MTTSVSTDRPRVRMSAEQRSSAVLAAATDIARSHGLSAVTLRAVATKLDVASSLVTHYEPSMDALVARAFQRIVSEELRDLDTEVRQFRTPLDQMRALIVSLLGGGRDAINVAWVEAYALGRKNPALANAVMVETRAWIGFVSRIIRAGVEDRVFKVENVGDTAWQLIGMIDGLNAQALVFEADALKFISQMARASEALLGAKPGSLAG